MKTIKLCNVKISEAFLHSNISKKKVEKAIRHIEKYGKVDKPIILKNGVLVDGYSRFLASKLKGIQEVPYMELQDMKYVVCKFNNDGKEYVWKNDRNIDVKVGDSVIVENRNKRRAIAIVYDIFLSDSLNLYKKHKSIIKKCNNNNN